VISLRYMVLPHGAGLPAPSYRSAHAAGLDLPAALPVGELLALPPSARALIPTGLSLELPAGFEGQIRPRSGLALRHGVTVLNAPGTIDADFRGEVQVLLINLGNEPFTIARGDRIAQLVISPITMVNLELAISIAATGRGEGGFGSTGVS